MASLPTEIVTEEIFPKVPTKSLVRFKCLSKSFNALISSPKFMDLHLRQHLSIDTNRLLIMTGIDDKHVYSVDLDSPDSVIAVNSIPFTDTLVPVIDAVSIVGTFNGLVCIGPPLGVGFREFKFYLINPFTGVSRKIPNNYISRTSSKYRETFGFGFDDIKHDYKLVRILENMLDDPNSGDNELQSREVMTYSLKDNSWKLIGDVNEPSDYIDRSQYGVLMKNHLLHWLFLGSNRFRICCFDVRSDKWANDVPLMDLFAHQMTDVDEEDRDKVIFHHLYLGVLNECLCASEITNLTGAVWVLKEYGVKESWVKLFEISPPNNCDFKMFGPYGFRRGSKRDVLIRSGDHPELCWSDISSGTYCRMEEIKGIPIFEEACFMERSLVSFPGGQKFQ